MPLTYDPALNAHPIASGTQFLVDCGGISGLDALDRIVLMAPGSITHHSDMSARYVVLPGSALSNTKMQVQIPSDGRVPRGFYMMFAVNSAGIPSVATWLRVT